MRSISRLSVALLVLAGCLPQNNNQNHGGQSGGAGGQAGGGGKGGGAGGSGGNGGSSAVASSGSGGSGSGGRGSGGAATGGADAAADSPSAQGGAGGSAGSAGSSAGGNGGRGGTDGTAGSGGSAGNSGSGGAPGTGGNTAPTACSFPSSWTVGSATYTTYTLPNDITACGYNGNKGANTVRNIVSPGNFAAIPGNSSSDFNTSNRCGACIQIGSAIVTIVDECPYDGNNNPPCKANPTGHMDLSGAAAGAAGVRGDPAVRGQAQWKYVPCPVNGNVVVRLKKGNSNEIFIENEILPIASVTCAGQNASRTSYGAWHFNSNVPGATCEVTDVSGRKISITVGTVQDQDVDTKVQFPKCL